MYIYVCMYICIYAYIYIKCHISWQPVNQIPIKVNKSKMPAKSLARMS